MYYCPPNVTFLNPWMKHGFSHCFADTVSTCFVFAFILIFGSVQIGMYMKFSADLDPRLIPKSLLYKLQIIFHVILPLMALIRLILQDDVYGYMILSACIYSITFPLALYLLYLERHKTLSFICTKGRGLVLLVYWTALFVSENLAFLNLRNENWWFQLKSLSDKIEFGLFVIRYVCCFSLFSLGLILWVKALCIPNVEDFLIHDRANIQDSIELLDSWSQSYARKRSIYAGFCKKCRRLIPFVWPKKSRMLQLRVFVCIFLLILGRGLVVFVSIFNQKIVDSLNDSPLLIPTTLILLYAVFWCLQGPGDNNLLSNIRTFLWISVEQYTIKEVEMDIYEPLHSLPLKWHLNKKIGEVRRVINRGTSRISSLLSYFLFNIFPTFVDIGFAVLYFVIFKRWSLLAVTILGTMALYLTVTICLIEWRTKFKRDANKLENEAEAKCVDSLLNFETVKYYNAEQFEYENYKTAIEDFQKADWKSIASLNLLNTAQNIIITVGVFAGSYLCASYVADENDSFNPGDYVMFSTYIAQLYIPLSYFGTHYRWFQNAFVDMENMFTLLDTKPEIVDKPDAKSLKVTDGSIEFRNVNFAYLPERQILKDISFTIPPGHTVAIVGPTGSGKSTITRLLFRFYDIGSGEILIDEQNITDVTQKSLRESIGVVPQDTVLFNNTIRYNIGYGRHGASFEEIQKAAKAVDMHDLILSFPNGYDTVVGERGLKLSAGEKQRVAIARIILKSPSLVILDEATSFLDTQTEKNIQKSLSNVCANKTALITAHRLSTIVHAHEILVLKEGEIVERGRHEELLNKSGMYAAMWFLQQEPGNKKND